LGRPHLETEGQKLNSGSWRLEADFCGQRKDKKEIPGLVAGSWKLEAQKFQNRQ